jgi:hypothetical protein
MTKPNESGNSDFNWPPIAICALLLGFAIAVYVSRVPRKPGAPDLLQQINQLFAWRSEPVAPNFGQALIITANSRDQLTAVTTLSPRGFHPLLAASEEEVQSQLRTHPGAVKLAVLDASLPDYVGIVRALKAILPADNIIVLKRSRRSEDIAPMLLDRLDSLPRVRLRNRDAAPVVRRAS